MAALFMSEDATIAVIYHHNVHKRKEYRHGLRFLLFHKQDDASLLSYVTIGHICHLSIVLDVLYLLQGVV